MNINVALKNSDRCYIEKQCKQCKHQAYCVGYLNMMTEISQYHAYEISSIWAARIQACKERGQYIWEDRLTKHDFEERGGEENMQQTADELAQKKAQYYQDNHDEIRAQQAQYYKDNKSAIRARRHARYRRHRSEILERRRQKYATRST